MSDKVIDLMMQASVVISFVAAILLLGLAVQIIIAWRDDDAR